jgi:hypothetical protein
MFWRMTAFSVRWWLLLILMTLTFGRVPPWPAGLPPESW